MAERRMFAKTIIDSDAFLDMPLSAQALYFHLGMQADDDGFINNPKKIQRTIGAAEDDLKLLIAKKFIIPFETGVVVIKHWQINNYIRGDRYKATVYQAEKAQLHVKNNKAYTLGIPSDNQVTYQRDTQVRLGKDSIGKYSIAECSEEQQPAPQQTQTQSSIPMTDYEYNALIKKYGKSFVDSKIERAKNYPGTFNYDTISKWCREDYAKAPKNKWSEDVNNCKYDFDKLEKQFADEDKPKANDDP